MQVVYEWGTADRGVEDAAAYASDESGDRQVRGLQVQGGVAPGEEADDGPL